MNIDKFFKLLNNKDKKCLNVKLIRKIGIVNIIKQLNSELNFQKTYLKYLKDDFSKTYTKKVINSLNITIKDLKKLIKDK